MLGRKFPPTYILLIMYQQNLKIKKKQTNKQTKQNKLKQNNYDKKWP